ncbi:hypothetical protein CDCA_CDCA02G0613 [Cyanidium caldarium]|uniref:Enoyl-[acyl-carrier-protein] reductase (NADH) n=1 Tax=Cyanidium caldarium TaxID=2771 RepID=A0AAV9IRP6_CYACA|nr:hypothetical protein CDCA_CDCA02G0613 [Cyanidium caldarium]
MSPATSFVVHSTLGNAKAYHRVSGCWSSAWVSGTPRARHSARWPRPRGRIGHRLSVPLRLQSNEARSPLVDLRGKQALVTGIANQRSIAFGVAQALKQAGAEIGVAYLPINERAESKIAKLVEPLSPTLMVPCDVQSRANMEALFDTMRQKWGGLDILVHCLAFADRGDLEGDFSKTSRDGFHLALGVSTYSLIEMCGLAKPLFRKNGSVVTLTYLGAERVVPNYNVMGVAKAGLECSVRYLASELGPQLGVRVNGVSAGPIRTLASSAIGGITTMIRNVEMNAPLRRTVTQEEVGKTAAFLLSEAASGITGQVLYVDSGYAIMGSPVFGDGAPGGGAGG